MTGKIVSVQLDMLMPLIIERLGEGNHVWFSPQGSSMLPMLREGLDSVRLSPLPEKLKKYDLPLYRRKNGQYVLHRIVKVEETYTCIGDNQFAVEAGLHHSQIIAVVTAFRRGEREYTVKDPGYRFYCRIWHYTRPFRRFCRGISGLFRRMQL